MFSACFWSEWQFYVQAPFKWLYRERNGYFLRAMRTGNWSSLDDVNPPLSCWRSWDGTRDNSSRCRRCLRSGGGLHADYFSGFNTLSDTLFGSFEKRVLTMAPILNIEDFKVITMHNNPGPRFADLNFRMEDGESSRVVGGSVVGNRLCCVVLQV